MKIRNKLFMSAGISSILAVGVLVLIRLDKTRDRNKIKHLIDFKSKYGKLKGKHLNDIKRFSKAFDEEKEKIDVKINYAIVLEDTYNVFLREFLNFEIPDFLNRAYNYESLHLKKEKEFYKSFSALMEKKELEPLAEESNLAHRSL